MKAISLWQPWASAIAMGLKQVETRHWSPPYTGRLAIHAAKRMTGVQQACIRDLRAQGIIIPYTLPLGCIVATCELLECWETERVRDSLSPIERALGDYSDRRFAWTLTNVRKLDTPVPFVGRQGFFTVPDELVTA